MRVGGGAGSDEKITAGQCGAVPAVDAACVVGGSDAKEDGVGGVAAASAVVCMEGAAWGTVGASAWAEGIAAAEDGGALAAETVAAALRRCSRAANRSSPEPVSGFAVLNTPSGSQPARARDSAFASG